MLIRWLEKFPHNTRVAIGCGLVFASAYITNKTYIHFLKSSRPKTLSPEWKAAEVELNRHNVADPIKSGNTNVYEPNVLEKGRARIRAEMDD